MKKRIAAVVLIAVLCIGWVLLNGTRHSLGPAVLGNEAVASAFREQRSAVQVTGEGVVTRILLDDNDGDRHQRFVLSLGPGQTVLVVHNIDLAPRLPSLELGDSVAFNGVYEWNSQGGLIHWTHHDPSGRQQAGWLKHKGTTFQ
jgi:hypothetical protein